MITQAQTARDYNIIPMDDSKRIRSCKWCGAFIYIIYVRLEDGRKRYVSINEGNDIVHRCMNKGRTYY